MVEVGVCVFVVLSSKITENLDIYVSIYEEATCHIAESKLVPQLRNRYVLLGMSLGSGRGSVGKHGSVPATCFRICGVLWGLWLYENLFVEKKDSKRIVGIVGHPTGEV